MKRIILTLILFASLFTSNLYSNTSEIPNEKVFDNPKKEVTTVEAKKNKEHTEMNVKVNKLNIQEIQGHDIGNGKTQYFIPKEEKTNKLLRSLINNTDNQYLIFETKEQLSEYLNKNKKARKKRDVTNPIQYEVMQDENQTMITVNSDKDVYILDNKNNVYFGKVLNNSKISDYTAELIFKHIDPNYIKYHYSNGRYEISTLKNKPLAYVFANAFFDDGGRKEYYLNNGKKRNMVTVDWGPYDYARGIWGESSSLFQVKERNGLAYISSNSGELSNVAVVLDMTQWYKSMGWLDVIEASELNFYNIMSSKSNVQYKIMTSIYMRGNWGGSQSNMHPGHLIKLRVAPINFPDNFGIETDIAITVLKRDLSDSSTVINSSDILEVNYTRDSDDRIVTGNYIDGRSFNLYQTMKDYNNRSFFISHGYGFNIDYNSNDRRPPITISNFDIGSSRKDTVPAFLNVKLPWGDYRLRRYTINVNLVDPNTDPLILNLGGKYSDCFYRYDRSRRLFFAENMNSHHQVMEHALINSTNSFLENVEAGTLQISATGDPTKLSNTYEKNGIIVSTEYGQLELKRNSSYSEPIDITFYLVGTNASTRRRDATKVRVIAPGIDNSLKKHTVKYDPRYKAESFGVEYNIPLDDSIYSKFINHESDISSSFRGNITKTDGYHTQATDGVVLIHLKGGVALQTYNNVAYDSRLRHYTLNFLGEIPPSPTSIESTMYLSGENVDYSNVKLIIEKAPDSDKTRVKTGSGTIDLTLAELNKEYIFNSSSLQNENLKLENSGDFIDAKSIFDNSSLINKIKVNSGQLLSNALYSDSDVEFRIDNSGNFLIKRKNEGEFSPKSYTIEYYYNEVKLGSYQLNVGANKKPQVVLEGIDSINFGALIPEKTSSLQSNFIVKSLTSANITLKVPENSQMTKRGATSKTNNTIPLKIESTQENNGNNINGWLKVSATPPTGTTPGEYEGTIDLTVTIQ